MCELEWNQKALQGESIQPLFVPLPQPAPTDRVYAIRCRQAEDEDEDQEDLFNLRPIFNGLMTGSRTDNF